ncbi:MAG TPA: response regulator transcription factor [Micromonosporaceae bacterium]
MRVLVCDDHKAFAESLALVLAEAGHQVVAVTHNPDEALAVLSRESADLCLLDLVYAHGTVLDRLAELRAAAPDAALVVLSGFTDPEVVAAAEAAGVRGFADKSQHVTEILAMLGRVAAGDRVITPVPAWPAVEPATRSESQRLAEFLTEREREVLCGLVRGDDTYALAKAMGVTWATVRSHVQSVLSKLGVHSRLEAATVAVRDGLVDARTAKWRAR